VAGVFEALSRSGVTVETVRRNSRGGSGRSDVALIVPSSQAATALAVLRMAQPAMDFEDLRHGGSVGRVSIAGVGMRSSPEVLCTFLNALSAVGIDCDLVEISETGIAGITRADRLADAERAVRLAFARAVPEEKARPRPSTPRCAPSWPRRRRRPRTHRRRPMTPASASAPVAAPVPDRLGHGTSSRRRDLRRLPASWSPPGACRAASRRTPGSRPRDTRLSRAGPPDPTSTRTPTQPPPIRPTSTRTRHEKGTP
jgi:hypothetical protein